jgi:hypothetical protein
VQPADLSPILHRNHFLSVYGGVQIQPTIRGQSSPDADTELIAVSVDVDKHIVAGADALAAKRRCGFENRAGIAQFGYFRLE